MNKGFIKFITDFGPLLIFFIFYYQSGLNLRVAMMNGGIATFKSFSLLKYIIKKTRRGPKSAISLIIGLYIGKC